MVPPTGRVPGRMRGATPVPVIRSKFQAEWKEERGVFPLYLCNAQGKKNRWLVGTTFNLYPPLSSSSSCYSSLSLWRDEPEGGREGGPQARSIRGEGFQHERVESCIILGAGKGQVMRYLMDALERPLLKKEKVFRRVRGSLD